MGLDFDLIIDVDTGNEPYRIYLFDGNAPHFLVPMWKQANVYDALYMSRGAVSCVYYKKFGGRS